MIDVAFLFPKNLSCNMQRDHYYSIYIIFVSLKFGQSSIVLSSVVWKFDSV